MLKLFYKIKDWIYSKTFFIDADAIVSSKSSMIQEDVRDKNVRRRVGQAFDAQQHLMQTRSMKAHDAACKDIFSCRDTFCFKPTADKIVNQEVVTVEAAKPRLILKKKQSSQE